MNLSCCKGGSPLSVSPQRILTIAIPPLMVGGWGGGILHRDPSCRTTCSMPTDDSATIDTRYRWSVISCKSPVVVIIGNLNLKSPVFSLQSSVFSLQSSKHVGSSGIWDPLSSRREPLYVVCAPPLGTRYSSSIT